MVRIALLGAGGHSARCHAPALQLYARQHPGEMELAALCDLDRGKAERLAQQVGFRKAYEDVETMLAEERRDALVAVTPVALTERIVSSLLPRGIPLLMEKPPGESSEAARRLMALAESHRTPHMISFNRRFSPALRMACEWLSENTREDPPRLVLARMLRHDRREPDFVTGTGIHLVDTVLSLLGEPEAVSASRLSTRTPGVFQFGSRIRFAPGGIAHLTIAPAVGTTEETYEILGEDYAIGVDVHRCAVRISSRGQVVRQWSAPEDSPPVFRDGTLGETEAFIQAVNAAGPFRPDLRDGLTALLTCEAIAAGGERGIAP